MFSAPKWLHECSMRPRHCARNKWYHCFRVQCDNYYIPSSSVIIWFSICPNVKIISSIMQCDNYYVPSANCDNCYILSGNVIIITFHLSNVTIICLVSLHDWACAWIGMINETAVYFSSPSPTFSVPAPENNILEIIISSVKQMTAPCYYISRDNPAMFLSQWFTPHCWEDLW